MTPSYSLVSIPSATLYAGSGPAGSALAHQPGGQFQGAALSIDDASGIGDCQIWIDGEGIGLPLARGQVLRRSFRSFRVAPMPPSTFPGAATLPAGSTAAVQLSPASLILRVWTAEPMAAAGLPVYPMVSIEQQVISLNGAGAGEYLIGWARVPAARSVTCWASNGNNANPGAMTLSLYTVRPQVPAGSSVAKAIRLGTLLGTATIPLAADADARVEVPIYFPGCYEVAWSVKLPATAGAYQVVSGLEVTNAQ